MSQPSKIASTRIIASIKCRPSRRNYQGPTVLHSKNLFIDTKLATFGHLQCYILNPIDFFHVSALKFILRVGNTDQGSTLWIVGGEDGDFAHNTSEFLTLNDSVPLPGQCCQLLSVELYNS